MRRDRLLGVLGERFAVELLDPSESGMKSTLVDLAEEDDTGKACFGVVGDGGVEDEDTWREVSGIKTVNLRVGLVRMEPSLPSAFVGTSW